MKKNTDERIYYDTTPSQDVVILQCKYTLFRRIVNIVCSMDTKEKIDWDIMEQAMYLTIVRNDCLRLKFVKKGGTLILSGIISERCHEVIDAVKAKGYTLVEQREANDWVAVSFKV